LHPSASGLAHQPQSESGACPCEITREGPTVEDEADVVAAQVTEIRLELWPCVM
jgi:hypothetical protein